MILYRKQWVPIAGGVPHHRDAAHEDTGSRQGGGRMGLGSSPALMIP